MPWTGQQFRSRHNHGLGNAQAGHAARIANAVLRSGAPEGESIAIANKWAQHHRAEGGRIGKHSHDEARYTNYGSATEHCSICEHFEAPHSCTEVKSPVVGRGWCKFFKHLARAGGGVIPHYDAGGVTAPMLGGPVPSTATAGPMQQNLIQRFAQMSPEQLQELSMRLQGSPIAPLIQRVLQSKRIMPQAGMQQPMAAPQQAPVAPIAGTPQMQAKGGVTRLAMGGMSPSMESPWWERADARDIAYEPSGFLHSPIGGRTDQIRASPAADSYVIPADVVSGIGEGNSLAGARALQDAMSTGPHGTPLPRGGAHGRYAGMPAPPRPYTEASRGGKAGDTAECLLAGGEFVVPPAAVRRIGGGDMAAGHRILDKWVTAKRDKIIKEMKDLPGPVK